MIGQANSKIANEYRAKKIPGTKSRIDTARHTIEGINFETHERFNSLKEEFGVKNNNQMINLMINFCRGNINAVNEFKTKEGRISVVSTP